MLSTSALPGCNGNCVIMVSLIYLSHSHAIQSCQESQTHFSQIKHQLIKLDVVAWVFKLKLKSLLHDIYFGPKPVFGKMHALIYVVEWQKQGPPHAHILAIWDPANKPQSTDDYNLIVSAEIPDPNTHPQHHAIVTKFMMHKPCGTANPKSGVLLDNKNVVPYNTYLSKRYNIHINVEICSSIQSCKYLYKYVYKGPHMASVGVEPHDKHDEIKKFVNSRFITASECMWRFFLFDVHERDPNVQCLAVLENKQHSVIFHED